METLLELKGYVYGRTVEKIGVLLLIVILLWGAYTDVSGELLEKYEVSLSGTSQVKSYIISKDGMFGEEEAKSIKDLESSVLETVPDDRTLSEVIEPETLIPEMEIPKTVLPEVEEIIPEIDVDIPEISVSEDSIIEETEVIIPEVPVIEENEISDSTIVGEDKEENNDEIIIIPSENMGSEEEPIQVIQSPFLIDEYGMLYGFLPELADLGYGYLELPSTGCIGIRSGAFAGCSAYIAEIAIPVGITNIENGALNNLVSLEWISVFPGNTMYLEKDGVLFDSTGTKLLAYPPARVGGYAIPNNVTEIAANAFVNTSLSTIDMRGCAVSENCLLNISSSCSIIR